MEASLSLNLSKGAYARCFYALTLYRSAPIAESIPANRPRTQLCAEITTAWHSEEFRSSSDSLMRENVPTDRLLQRSVGGPLSGWINPSLGAQRWTILVVTVGKVVLFLNNWPRTDTVFP